MTSPNPKPNEHIERRLDEYCNNAGNNYALLINGKWGIGKTYFILEYIKKSKKNKPDNRIIYTNVNGISKTSDLSRAMLNALSDVKSNFCIILIFIKLLFKFLFALVVAAFLISPLQWYIDKFLNCNCNFKFVLILILGSLALALALILLCRDTIFALLAEHVSTNVVVCKIYSLFFKKDSYTLVFDDLERSLIPMEELLGYINYFIEEKNIKTIIIANTEKISDKQQENEKQNTQLTQWNKIKEKIIATSFTLTEDVDTVVDIIFNKVQDTTLKDKLLKEYKHTVIEVFNKAGYKNFRTLKHSINSFNWFYTNALSQCDDIDHDKFRVILQTFLILSLEYYHSSNVLEKLWMQISQVSEKQKDKKIEQEFFDKYQNCLYNLLCVSYLGNEWKEIIFDNKIDKQKIKQQFKVYNPPPWHQLMGYFKLENDKIITLINTVKNDLKEILVGKEGEVKHIISLLMYFQEKKVININIDEYIGYAGKNLKKIYEELSWDKLEIDNDVNGHEHTLGSSFYSKDNDNFKNFINQCKEIRKNVLQSKYQEQAKELLELLQNNPDEFCRKIKKDGIYYNNPVLEYIEAKEFMEKFLQWKNADKKKIVDALINRYRYYNNSINTFISSEGKSWLPKIIQQLKEIQKQEDIPLTKLLIENYIRWLDMCLTNL